MAYYVIEGKDGTAIVDDSEALHLYLRKKDADWVRKNELDPKTDVVSRVELYEPDDEAEGEGDQVYFVRSEGSDNLLTTTEEGGPDGQMTYLLAFLDDEDAQKFIDGELKEADPDQASKAEIVEAMLVRE